MLLHNKTSIETQTGGIQDFLKFVENVDIWDNRKLKQECKHTFSIPILSSFLLYINELFGNMEHRIHYGI